MTDVPNSGLSVPSRLGVTARFVDGDLTLDLVPQPQALVHGVVRVSVLAFVVDAAAGVPADADASMWTLTSDMSVRMRPVLSPPRISSKLTILRRSRRSITCLVDLTTDQGELVATGAIGFVNVARKESDPPKPRIGSEDLVRIFGHLPGLTKPLREEAGIEVLDAAEGVVQVEVTPELCNPAGTLQGAMVALVAEAAAEDLVVSRYGAPVVATSLDLRYLRRAPAGRVRTESRLLGTDPDSPVEVSLLDATSGDVTTLAFVSLSPAPENVIVI